MLSRALGLAPGDVVALVGGGGKSSALFRLGIELASDEAAPRRVLLTTTTRIFAAQINQAPAHLSFDPAQEPLGELLPRLEAALISYGQALLTAPIAPGSEKAPGLPAAVIDALAAAKVADVILVEADGSRMRPFKAPAGHEPVIPASATLVIPVVGLDVLGQPLNAAHVHRPERVSALSETPLGRPVSLETVAAVVTHPQGGLKNVPAGARVVALLNKAESSARLAAGREIAARLLKTARLEAVLLGAVKDQAAPVKERWGRTAAVVLAAGGSSRFGSPKQLASWRGQTFIERATDVALASEAEPVVVVLGAEVSGCRAALGERPVRVVINKEWAEGQSSSMQAGLAALPPGVTGALFLLVDLPGVTPEIINRLIARHRQTLAPLVWPEFEGRRGNPVLFDRRLFPELRRVEGDTGGKPVLLAHRAQAERVAVDDRGVVQDFDRPEDLAGEGQTAD